MHQTVGRSPPRLWFVRSDPLVALARTDRHAPDSDAHSYSVTCVTRMHANQISGLQFWRYSDDPSHVHGFPIQLGAYNSVALIGHSALKQYGIDPSKLSMKQHPLSSQLPVSVSALSVSIAASIDLVASSTVTEYSLAMSRSRYN